MLCTKPSWSVFRPGNTCLEVPEERLPPTLRGGVGVPSAEQSHGTQDTYFYAPCTAWCWLGVYLSSFVGVDVTQLSLLSAISLTAFLSP